MVSRMNAHIFDAKNLILGALCVVFALLPLVPGALPSSFTTHVWILILLFASMSQAWNILGGYCGQVSFGHSVFFGIGAYGAGLAVVIFNAAPWPGMLLGASVAAIVAILISWPVFKLSGHYFAIATFAIVEIFNRLFMVWYFKSPDYSYQVGGALGS